MNTPHAGAKQCRASSTCLSTLPPHAPHWVLDRFPGKMAAHPIGAARQTVYQYSQLTAPLCPGVRGFSRLSLSVAVMNGPCNSPGNSIRWFSIWRDCSCDWPWGMPGSAPDETASFLRGTRGGVSFHSALQGHQLRGCVGRIDAAQPLIEALRGVGKCAEGSALRAGRCGWMSSPC